MALRYFTHASEMLRTRFQQFLYTRMFPGHLQLDYTLSGNLSGSSSADGSSFLDSSIWLAGPKSKISPGRKREKHGRFVPDKTFWQHCDRCGESRRPHRICSKHAQLCAMRKEDWAVYKVTHAVDIAQGLHLAKAKENAEVEYD